MPCGSALGSGSRLPGLEPTFFRVWCRSQNMCCCEVEGEAFWLPAHGLRAQGCAEARAGPVLRQGDPSSCAGCPEASFMKLAVLSLR